MSVWYPPRVTARRAWRELLDADQAWFAARDDLELSPRQRLAAQVAVELKRAQFVRVLGGDA